MTHAHRRPMNRRERSTVAAVALILAGLGTGIGLVATADDVDAAPALPPVRLCEEGASGGMRCTDRPPLWPASQTLADQAAFQQAAAAEFGALVGRRAASTVVLLAVP